MSGSAAAVAAVLLAKLGSGLEVSGKAFGVGFRFKPRAGLSLWLGGSGGERRVRIANAAVTVAGRSGGPSAVVGREGALGLVSIARVDGADLTMAGFNAPKGVQQLVHGFIGVSHDAKSEGAVNGSA